VIRAGQLSDSTLIARTIFEDHLVTCASPDYLGRCGTPASPQELETDHQILGYFSAATGEMWPLRFSDGGKERSFSRFDLAANDSAGLIRMMVAGLGVGQTHESVARPFLESGELVALLSPYTQTAIPISVIYPQTRQLNSRVRVFIDWVVELLSTGSPM